MFSPRHTSLAAAAILAASLLCSSAALAKDFVVGLSWDTKDTLVQAWEDYFQSESVTMGDAAGVHFADHQRRQRPGAASLQHRGSDQPGRRRHRRARQGWHRDRRIDPSGQGRQYSLRDLRPGILHHQADRACRC